jgi:NADH dehydrogenase [ubiquinone] 1 alpha subcomplex assembly factor 5
MRRPFLPRETAVAARTLYVEKSFEVLYMTGWRSHESQQSAKQRGSATVSLADLQKHLDGEK